MQGNKEYSEKFFVNFRLSEKIPKENFYYRLKDTLDLSYLREKTKNYYGREGQKSIAPTVFFKLMLIGFIENINSDRKIIESSSLRLDILYFLGYNIDEPLPWHSTLSRTRKLFGEEILLEFFRDILRKCAEKGMICGKTQAIDSAYIKANASIENMSKKMIDFDSKKYFDEITENEDDCEKKSEKKKISNATHFSPSDSDSRLSTKRNKALALNHLGIISVDTKNHIISSAAVDFADKKDMETTEFIIEKAIENLEKNGLEIEEILADRGYGSWQTYQYLGRKNITAFIPPINGYKPQKEGFTYNREKDCYVCQEGKILPFKSISYKRNGNEISKVYRCKTKDCKICPRKVLCCNTPFKVLADSYYKPYYDAAQEIIDSKIGARKMRKRSATVEPVWGTLLNFMGMKKVYVKGNLSANKQLLMASAAYNLKKLMKFTCPKSALNTKIAVKLTVKHFEMSIFDFFFLKQKSIFTF